MVSTIDELTWYLKGKVNSNLYGLNLSDKCTWDMVLGDCILGWDVSVYFKQGYLTGHTVMKCLTTIYKTITGRDDFDLTSCEIEFNDDWLKYSFQADPIIS